MIIERAIVEPNITNILTQITNFVKAFVQDGLFNTTSSDSVITHFSKFIFDHKLILAFVLCSLLCVGIGLIRRLAK